MQILGLAVAGALAVVLLVDDVCDDCVEPWAFGFQGCVTSFQCLRGSSTVVVGFRCQCSSWGLRALRLYCLGAWASGF